VDRYRPAGRRPAARQLSRTSAVRSPRSPFELLQLTFPLGGTSCRPWIFAAGAHLDLSSIIAIRRPASGYRKQLVAKPGELRFTPQAQSAEPRPVGLEVREVGEELREKSRE
jgi:hypothetical protein